MLQHFAEKAEAMGIKKAKFHLLKDVLLLFRPGIIRSPKLNQKLNTSMLKHHLTISIRTFKTDKVSFAVNLAGLVTGLTSVILIYLWIGHEMRMDSFHQNPDRLYQVFLNEETPNGIDTDSSTPVLLAQTLETEFPEVAQAVSVIPYEWFGGERFMVSDGADKILISKNQFASPGFFSLFSFPLIAGNPDTALDSPDKVAISESLAMKLFKTSSAVGKRLDWLHSYYGGTYQVSAVFADVQENSTMQFDAVFPFEVIIKDEGEEWLGWTESDPDTYCMVQSGTNMQDFEQKIAGIMQSKNPNLNSSLMLQRYADSYLYDRYENGLAVAGRMQYVRLFAAIALLILVVASLNFMIMATAKAGLRMKEIGIKKAMGAQRKSLIYQFFTESVLITFLAFALALGLVKLSLPVFSQVAGHKLGLQLSLNEWLALIILALTTALLSGIYPALHLSGFKAIAALKGKTRWGGQGQLTRKAFVVTQFVVSTVLVITTLVVSEQIKHIQSKNLGFEKENLVWFTMGSPATESADAENPELDEAAIKGFLDRLREVPGVESSSNFAHNVLGAYGTTTGLSWPGKEAPMLIAQFSGGHDLISTLNIEMAEGRTFSRDLVTDRQKIILNETAIAEMELSDPIGKTVNLWGEEREIIGICRDFHIDQLYHDIMPVFIKVDLNNFAPHVLVRMSSGNQQATLKRIETTFSDYFMTGYPFEPKFMNDDYQQYYQEELRVGIFAKYACAIAIFIACLGIFAFSGLTLKRRMHELAIRKVLGSGLKQLSIQVFSGFLQIMALSAVLAIPLALLVSQSWLESFVFRIALSPWLFVIAILMMLALMLLSVSYHALQAVRVNVLQHLKQAD